MKLSYGAAWLCLCSTSEEQACGNGSIHSAIKEYRSTAQLLHRDDTGAKLQRRLYAPCARSIILDAASQQIHADFLVADLRLLPLPCIAPERTCGPERVGRVDPGGLRGFLHLGLHVWVDLRG